MFCFFFYSCLCVCICVCAHVLRPECNSSVCPVLCCLANCGSCYLGHLQHGLPLFYAFHFHVQFRIWRTLSLKDCTWKFNRRCSSFTSLQSTDSSVPPVPPTAILRPTPAEYLRCVAALWWPILWWLRCALSVPTALGPVAPPHTLSLCVYECVWYVRSSDWLNSNEMWNVIRLPAMCHVYLPASHAAKRGQLWKQRAAASSE